MLEVKEHDVEARWSERDGFTRFDFETTLYRAHFHDTAFHCHAVNLALRACIIGNATDDVGGRAFVRDCHITSARFCALWRGARPRLCDVDRADIVVGSHGGE